MTTNALHGAAQLAVKVADGAAGQVLSGKCFGVACDVHGRCRRYAAVDGAATDLNTIGTCMTHAGYPLFDELPEVPA